MKKVCIIGASSLRYMPYLRCYEEVLSESAIPFDILYWDRFGLEETKDNAFAYRCTGTVAGLSLLLAYAGYRRFLLQHLKSATYETYIVLGTQMGVLLYDFLRTRRFMLDIRDFSHERMLLYRLAVHGLIKRSRLTCISSRGFLRWLPIDGEYTISHNMIADNLNKKFLPFDGNSKVLSYIGAFSHYDANLKLINSLKNRKDIKLRYIGRGTHDEQLKDYCRSHNINNVSVYGSFSPEQKERFYHETNFVIGCFGSNTMIVRTTMPNRLYESCLYRRPIIVNDCIYIADVVRDNGLGIVVDLNNLEGLKEAMMKYYDPIYFGEYSKRCEKYLSKVKDDIVLFKEKVRLTLSQTGN